ncbi:MAG TPA: Nramp family divalent metal transporter [Stellaceae bacterium]|nr:Nramp family divalent metal transporter [Stellaceae bacterium]
MLFRRRHHRRPRHAAAPAWRRVLQLLGPGLITGASDDDPSGIATYSQAGAQFGYSMCWVMLFTWPLMAAIQEISARIGRVTGKGIAANLREHYPVAALRGMVLLLIGANFLNLGADLGAMGDALRLIVGGPAGAYVVLFAALCAVLEIYSRYDKYVRILKWLTLSLFAYVATALLIHVPWGEVAYNTLVPHPVWKQDYLVVIVAVLGTTISPYLFFWQASEEAEDERVDPAARPLAEAPQEARREIRRIEFDTYIGMGFSNVIALFIIITTAATLHQQGVTDISTSEQAAQALRPVAGEFAFFIFALGILGTGLLAIPVLAGSAAYAVAETIGQPTGLARQPREAKAFYATIVGGTLVGVVINFVNLDPMKALFWVAVINGVVAVPVMVMMMLMTMRREVMGDFTLPRPLWVVGWLSTAAMAVAVVAMFATWSG